MIKKAKKEAKVPKRNLTKEVMVIIMIIITILGEITIMIVAIIKMKILGA
jgi:hypothetical protein